MIIILILMITTATITIGNNDNNGNDKNKGAVTDDAIVCYTLTYCEPGVLYYALNALSLCVYMYI